MIFADKIIVERKKLGLSQEQLADRLGVTRQSVSKWESGATLPELSKIVQMSEMFCVSVDYMVKESMENDFLMEEWKKNLASGQRSGRDDTLDNSRLEEKVDDLTRYLKGYSYTSKTKILGIPLVSVRFSRRFDKDCVAKGIVAVGNISVGVISVGAISVGGISIGVMSAGAVALGAVAVGLGVVGVVTCGVLSLGIVTIGIYAAGVVTSGKELAVGVIASGKTVIGEMASGDNVLQYYSGIPIETIKGFLAEHCSGIWKPLRDLFAFLGSIISSN